MAEQDESKVMQLAAITGGDLGVCAGILASCDGNLEAAINLLVGGPTPPRRYDEGGVGGGGGLVDVGNNATDQARVGGNSVSSSSLDAVATDSALRAVEASQAAAAAAAVVSAASESATSNANVTDISLDEDIVAAAIAASLDETGAAVPSGGTSTDEESLLRDISRLLTTTEPEFGSSSAGSRDEGATRTATAGSFSARSLSSSSQSSSFATASSVSGVTTVAAVVKTSLASSLSPSIPTPTPPSSSSSSSASSSSPFEYTLVVSYIDQTHIVALPRSGLLRDLQGRLQDLTGLAPAVQLLFGWPGADSAGSGGNVRLRTLMGSSESAELLLASLDEDAVVPQVESAAAAAATAAGGEEEGAGGRADEGGYRGNSRADSSNVSASDTSLMSMVSELAKMSSSSGSISSSSEEEEEEEEGGSLLSAYGEAYGDSPLPPYANEQRPRRSERRRGGGARDTAGISPYSDEEDAAIFGEQDAEDLKQERESLIPPERLNDPGAFAERFSARYGANSPSFLPLAFTEAAAIAADEPRPLLVYLHDDLSVETNVFCDVLCNKVVGDYLSRHFVLWGWDMSWPAARHALFTSTRGHVRISHRISGTYPCLVSMVRTRSGWRIMDTIEGFHAASDLVERLERAQRSCAPILTEQAAERQRLRERAAEVSAQDSAFEQSLKADRAKAEQRAREEREQKEREAKEKLARQESQAERQTLAEGVPDEPASDAEDVCVVQFRMPGGQRIKRRFARTWPLRVVANFLGSQGYRHSAFQMVIHPHRVLSSDVFEQTIASLGLGARQLITVEEL
eukprot:UC1_evm1s888